MTSLATKTRTALALGVRNIVRVAAYRAEMKLLQRPGACIQAPKGPFFSDMPGGVPITAPAVTGWHASALLFGHLRFGVTAHPPDWLANPLTGQGIASPSRDWRQIPDFDPGVGDIKLIWELSRMDWVLAFAQRAKLGDATALARLNDWLEDWCARNPPFRGPNWKCGQEASIRVMHLATAAIVLGQVRNPTEPLRELVRLHLRRIASTLRYALAQDNNHGTSEAAALFIGGSWLGALGDRDAEPWQRLGLHWLEERAARLIGPQGTFSQYSLNYHRLMLDTFSIAEVWRRHLGLPSFSTLLQSHALAATKWLHHMIEPGTGDGPNVGANDGARLLQLTNTTYRDHRPSLQLAMALFADERACSEDGPWNHQLQWLGIPLPEKQAQQPRNSFVADDGGFAVLRRGIVMVMLRYPRFRFRPSQADALHLDLWVGCVNLLRDAGSYSYNTDPVWLNYFGGTPSHNTVEFDGRDQMPRISRFLFGDWLETTDLEDVATANDVLTFAAGYRDRQQARHLRRITLSESALQVEDQLAGFTSKAVLRWRLMPGSWRADGNRLVSGSHSLTVHGTMPIVRFELVKGWESRHYLEKTPCPVLEVEVRQPGTLNSNYRWAE